MRGLAGVYLAKFRSEFALQVAYRGAMAIWLIGLLLEPIVYLVVWTTVARSQGNDVAGFGAADFAGYFVVLMVVNQLTFTWHFFFFEWRVKHGALSPLLLRPVHPIHNDIAENLTFKALTMAGVLPVAAFLVVSFGAVIRPEPWHVVAFVPALVLAMALRFLVEWTVALAAFWLTRIAAVNQAYYLLVLFLSGQVAPLAVLPEAVQTIASVLPFRWMVSFPVELALGRLGPTDVLIGYAAQLAWIGVAFIVFRWAWAAGLRRYSAVGA
jgi:ABC-2 type transport system permease protein